MESLNIFCSVGLFQQIIDALADVRNFEARIGHDSSTHAENDWNSAELEMLIAGRERSSTYPSKAISKSYSLENVVLVRVQVADLVVESKGLDLDVFGYIIRHFFI